jgi:hypothetical protein
MAFLTKIRDAVRRWLGVDKLATSALVLSHHNVEQKRFDALEAKLLAQHAAHLTALSAVKDAQAKIATNLEELCGKLDRIESMLITAHAFEKPAPMPSYDYDAMQINHLADMLAHPPKENEQNGTL